MLNFEIEKSYNGPVIGLDEVGRGPLAGPVISCGCIFTDYDYLQDKLNLSITLFMDNFVASNIFISSISLTVAIPNL